MHSPSHLPRVVVIGGGILGVSAAVHLVRLGATVTLVTEARPGSGASGRSLSWLNSSRRRAPHYHQLRTLGIDRYRTLAHKLPQAPWLRFDGGITWDPDNAQNDIAGVFEHERAVGYDAQLLSPEDVARTVPGIDPRAVTRQGAIFNPGEGWVHLPSLIEHLLGEYRARRGALIEQKGRARLALKGDRVEGAVLGDGELLTADAVLLATGPDVPRDLRELGVHVPDATPISLLVKTGPVASRLRAVVNTERVSIRPEPDGTLVMDASWTESEVHPDGSGGFVVRPETVDGLLREAGRILEGNPVLKAESFDAGLKPIPGDGEPVLGPIGQAKGCHVAFSHSGATLGLIAGELLADEIVSQRPHRLLANFRADRFL